MPVGHKEELLILAKTYPSPSTKYTETTCVAAINKQRQLRRLFPVPFRYLGGEKRFQKWEWITAQISKAKKDHRPESHTIDIDSIVRNGVISTKDSWQDRLCWIQDSIYKNPDELEKSRIISNTTLGLIRPVGSLRLEIKKSDKPSWTVEEQNKLKQDLLFQERQAQDVTILKKIPYDFYYNYQCDCNGVLKNYCHKINDWEAGALYWNCWCSHGNNWEEPFRQKLEKEFSESRSVIFLLGTIHRFPHQWLIIAFYYPPKSHNTNEQLQLTLA